MSPGAHLLASWAVANASGLARRERRLVTLAGVIPDLDGVGVVADILNGWRGVESDVFQRYHHLWAHNALAGLFLALAVALLASRQRMKAAGLALATFHLHLLCDLVGSRGPDGYQWPIPYAFPFTRAHAWVWQRQWDLNAWPNLLILALLFGLAVAWSWKQRYSFIEVISHRLDRAIFAAIERRWPA